LISFYPHAGIILGRGNDFFPYARKNSCRDTLTEYFEEVVLKK
jgi:hypothetical protein